MNQHPPDSQLALFVDGKLDESTSVDLAMHLDSCPACRQRAASMDPCTELCSRAEHIEPPPELMHRVLAGIASSSPSASTVHIHSVWLGLFFLLLASLMLFLWGDPTGLMAGALSGLGGLGVSLSALGRILPTEGLICMPIASLVPVLCFLALYVMQSNENGSIGARST